MRVLTDADVRAALDAPRAVRWVREAVVAAHEGRLRTPPRVHAELGPGRLTFTTGALTGRWFGYRSYDSFPGGDSEQVVVVHDWATGQLRGLVIGREIGPRRVGAIGALACDEMADTTDAQLAVIGSGRQAWHQVWAISAIRTLRNVVVYSRDEERRRAFAARVRDEFAIGAHAVDTPREAVERAHLVVLATDSPTPVIDAAWLRPGAWVTTLGPKQHGRAEFGPDLVEWADVVVTDSIAQTRAYDPPFVLAGTRQATRLQSLGSVVAKEVPVEAGNRLFCSVGLAGTETFLAARLLG